MTVRSYRQVAAGVVVALAVPVFFRLCTLLIEHGIMSIDEPIDWTPSTIIALSEIVLGPLGVVIAGRGAGVRGVIAWIVLLVVTIPILFLVWAFCVLMLSAALGAPF